MAFRDQIQRKLDAKRTEIADIETSLSAAKAYAQALEDMLKLAPKESAEATQQMALRAGSALAETQQTIIKAGKPLHISEILKELGKDDTKENRVSLAGSLATYAREGKVFTKPGPNVFGLIGMEVKEELGEQKGPFELKVA